MTLHERQKQRIDVAIRKAEARGDNNEVERLLIVAVGLAKFRLEAKQAAWTKANESRLCDDWSEVLP